MGTVRSGQVRGNGYSENGVERTYASYVPIFGTWQYCSFERSASGQNSTVTTTGHVLVGPSVTAVVLSRARLFPANLASHHPRTGPLVLL